jgi:hypothetical protein
MRLFRLLLADCVEKSGLILGQANLQNRISLGSNSGNQILETAFDENAVRIFDCNFLAGGVFQHYRLRVTLSGRAVLTVAQVRSSCRHYRDELLKNLASWWSEIKAKTAKCPTLVLFTFNVGHLCI